MVQISVSPAPTPRQPTRGELASQAIGEGISGGMQYMLSDMIEKQKANREWQNKLQIGTKVAKGLGRPELAELFAYHPQSAIKYITEMGNTPARDVLSGGKIDVSKFAPPEQGNFAYPGMEQNEQYQPQGYFGQNMQQGFQLPGQIPTQQPQQQQEQPQSSLKSIGGLTEPEFQRYKESQPSKLWPQLQKARESAKNLGIKQESLNYKKKQDVIQRADKKIEPIVKEIQEKSADIPARKAAVRLQRDAIERGNFGPLSVDHILTALGIDESVSKDASQFKFAIKSNLLDSLAQATGRPNQYLEQLFVGASGEIGATKEGNLILADGAANRIALDELKVDTWDEIENKYLNDPNYGYVPEKAAKEYRQKVRESSRILEDNLMLKIQEDRESQMSKQQLMNLTPNATPTPLTPKRARAIFTKAMTSLQKALGREPTKQEISKYYDQLIKDNNYFEEE